MPVSLGHGDFLGKPSPLVSRTGFAGDGPADTPTSWVPRRRPLSHTAVLGRKSILAKDSGQKLPLFPQTHGRCRRSCSGWGGLTGVRVGPGLLRATYAALKTKDEEHATETPRLWGCWL